jgi:hypothetical protein
MRLDVDTGLHPFLLSNQCMLGVSDKGFELVGDIVLC